MITPKKTFAENKALSKGWQDIVDSKQFHEAATAALAEMEINLMAISDMATAAALNWQMQGAKRYLHTLMSLTQPAPPGTKPPKTGLDYRA